MMPSPLPRYTTWPRTRKHSRSKRWGGMGETAREPEEREGVSGPEARLSRMTGRLVGGVWYVVLTEKMA